MTTARINDPSAIKCLNADPEIIDFLEVYGLLDIFIGLFYLQVGCAIESSSWVKKDNGAQKSYCVLTLKASLIAKEVEGKSFSYFDTLDEIGFKYSIGRVDENCMRQPIISMGKTGFNSMEEIEDAVHKANTYIELVGPIAED